MPKYRFCGSKTEVGDLTLKKFGQVVEFPDQLAKEVILGGGCIIPAADFDGIGFTEQELSIYSDPNSHAQALAAFLAKKKKGITICHDLRTRLEAERLAKLQPPAPAAVEAAQADPTPSNAVPVDAKAK